MTEKILLLNPEDPKTEQALSSGWVLERRVIARKVLEPSKMILFEFIDEKIGRPKAFSLWLQTVRAFSLTATGTPCLAVLIFGLASHASLHLGIGLSSLVGVLLLQIAINVFNDVEDYRRLIDLPGTLGGSGVIQEGWWTPKELNRVAWTSLILGALFGLPAVLNAPSILLPIGFLATIGVLLYSGRSLGLKYVAMGDCAVWFLCGPLLTLGFSLAVFDSQQSHAGVLWVGAFFGFLAAALLHVNNLQDMNLDRSRGVKTLAIWLGFVGSLRFLVLLYLSAGASLLVAVISKSLPPTALMGSVLTLAISAPWLKKLSSSLGPESSLFSNCRIRAAQIHLLGGASLILGLAMEWLIR